MDSFLKPIILFLVTIAPCHSEIFTLKSGETLEGKILENTTEHYKILHQFSKSIKYEKTIKKSDIVKIEQSEESKEDLKAYNKIKALIPIPDAKSLKYYDEIIQKLIIPFNKEFPDSKHKDDVQKILATLYSEKEHVQKGSIKINGKFLSADEIKKDSYDVNAKMIGSQTSTALKNGRILPILRNFQKLQDEYQFSDSYREHRAPVLKKLNSYLALLERKEATPDEGPTEDLLKKLSNREKAMLLRQNEEKSAALERRIAREIENNEVWLTVDFSNKTSISQAIKQSSKLIKGIEQNIALEPVDAGALYREAVELLKGNDYKATKTVVQKFNKLSPPATLREQLKTEVKAQYKRVRAERLAAKKAKADEIKARKKAKQEEVQKEE